jgi:hypothetical protein
MVSLAHYCVSHFRALEDQVEVIKYIVKFPMRIWYIRSVLTTPVVPLVYKCSSKPMSPSYNLYI